MSSNLISSHLAPFQKLERSKNIDADGSEADCPFRVGGESETGHYKQQNAQEDPGGVADDGEKSKLPADDRAESIECNQCRVTKHHDREEIQDPRLCAKELGERSGSEDKEEPTRE